MRGQYFVFFKYLISMILTTCMLTPGTAMAARVLIEQPLDFTLFQALPPAKSIVFGYSKSFFKWQEWLNRRSSGPMLVPMENPIPALEVFEARSAGIIDRPISTFSRSTLLNINTIRALDPSSIHVEIPGGKKFAIQTTIPFPPSWSEIINAAKKTGFLAEKTSDKLIIDSEFSYINLKQTPATPAVDNFISLLNIYNTRPDVINIQGFMHINQIAKFGSLISFYYALDANHTLLVNYFALGIKKKDLDRGLSGMDVRSIFLGDSLPFNTTTGIGAGLPKYTQQLFKSIFEAWD